MSSMLDELQSAAEAAVASYKETATLCRSKLEHYRSLSSESGILPEAEGAAQLGRVSWLTCMLLTTSDEALRTSHALMRMREQHTVDQLAAARAAASRATDAEVNAVAAAEQLRKQLAEAVERSRKHALEAHQQRNRDAGRLKELQTQVKDLQETARLNEATWREDRRAELAVAAQREKNFSSAILRLQKELEAAKSMADKAKAKAEAEVGTAARRQSELQSECMRLRAMAEAAALGDNGGGAALYAPPEGETPSAANLTLSEEPALRQRVAELEAQCEQGVKLIEMLKHRLEQQVAATQQAHAAAHARATASTKRALHAGGVHTPKTEVHATPVTRGVAAVQAGSGSGGDASKASMRREAEVVLLCAELRDVEGALSAAECFRAEELSAMEHRVRLAEETARAASHGMLAAAARARRASENITTPVSSKLEKEALEARTALAAAMNEKREAEAKLRQVPNRDCSHF